jgi:hypothetical protein
MPGGRVVASFCVVAYRHALCIVLFTCYGPNAELFEITPERVKIVNDTIWDVISNQPDAKAKP